MALFRGCGLGQLDHVVHVLIGNKGLSGKQGNFRLFVSYFSPFIFALE